MLSALILQSVATQHCLVRQLLHHRLRFGVPFVLSETSSQPLSTHPVDSNRSGSRRSKPSSRSVLMGEHPHPWPRLHGQDTESRHRSNKPAGRYGLAPQTIQLSPEYLFCHTRASTKRLLGFAKPRFRVRTQKCSESCQALFCLCALRPSSDRAERTFGPV